MPLRFYITNVAAQIASPGHVAGRWDDVAGKTVVALGLAKAGANIAVAREETSTSGTHDVCLVQAISAPIMQAVTLTGGFQAMIALLESDAAADFIRGTSIWIVRPDGTQRGVMIGAVGSLELPTTLTGVSGTGTCASVAVQRGDRIVVEFGYRTVNISATPYTGTTRVGGVDATDLDGSTTGVTTRSGWIEFADISFVTAFTPATPATVLNIGTGAGQNYFALQLSRPADSTIATIGLTEIAAGFSESPRFATTSDGQRVHFEATVGGPTTAGSPSTRCELREVNAAGANISWDPLSGEHDMQGITTITALPPTNPDAVICQTFSDGLSADLCSIRTQLVSGTIRLRFRFNGVSVATPQIIAPYATNIEFAWRTRIVGGVIEAYWSTGGATLPATPQIVTAQIPATATNCYFKSGMYNQSTTAQDAGTAVGASELRDLRVTHIAATVVQPTAFFLAAA